MELDKNCETTATDTNDVYQNLNKMDEKMTPFDIPPLLTPSAT